MNPLPSNIAQRVTPGELRPFDVWRYNKTHNVWERIPSATITAVSYAAAVAAIERDDWKHPVRVIDRQALDTFLSGHPILDLSGPAAQII